MNGEQAGLAPRGDSGWAFRGACIDSDPELFFPIGTGEGTLRQVAKAKSVCARCVVLRDCLGYALRTGQDAGVWGGTTAEERRAIRSASAPAQRESSE